MIFLLIASIVLNIILFLCWLYRYREFQKYYIIAKGCEDMIAEWHEDSKLSLVDITKLGFRNAYALKNGRVRIN